jgi:tetratricopeptide (TPR) repeat protein
MKISELLEEAKRDESLGKLDDAIIALEKALLVSPENKEIILTLSRLYIGKGKLLKALELINSATNLKIDPDALMQEANIYMLLNRFEEAEAKLREALQYGERSPIYNNLGVVLLQLRRGNEAIQALKKSIDLDPNNINTYLNLVTFYESQGDLDGALDTLEKVLSKGLKNEELIEKYVQLLSKKGEYEKALSFLDEEIKQRKENLSLKLIKVRILYFAKKFKTCIEEIKKIERDNILSPQNKRDLLEIKEQAYFNSGDEDSSLNVIDELINLSNNNSYYLFRKAQVLYSSKNFLEALKILSNLLNQKNTPKDLRSDTMLLMKNIEIENWKKLVKLLIEEPTMKDALLNDLIFTLQSTGILLPEDGLLYIRNVLDQIKGRFGSFKKPPKNTIS